MPDPRPVSSLTLEQPRLLSWPARHAYSVLAALCLMLWLPGLLSLPALDRDESRIAQAARHMLDTGDFAHIRFDAQSGRTKPLGVYWAEAAATAAVGDFAQSAKPDHGAIWTYRLPSLLGGIAAVWLTVWAGSLFGAEAGLLAGLLIGFSVLMTAIAGIATPDALFLAATLGTETALMRIYCAKGELGTAIFGWAAFAVAVLLEGLAAIGVVGATVAALLIWDWRASFGRGGWLKRTRPFWGVPLFLLILAAWLMLAAPQGRGMPILAAMGEGAIRLPGADGHGAPPGYYLLVTTIGFWPAILFLLPALGFSIPRTREPAIRFLVAWAGGSWAMLALVPAKLPNYVSPVYPALAILIAIWLLAPAAAESSPRLRRLFASVSALQFLIGLAAMAAAPILLLRLYGRGEAPLFAVILAAMLGLAALAMRLTGARLMALPLALFSFAILAPTLTVSVAPKLDGLWTGRTLAALVAKDGRPGDPPPALAGYREPSLLFALNDKVRLTDGRGAAEWGAYLGGLALVADSERPAFLERLRALYSDAVPIGRVHGFNYSRGQRVNVTVYRVRALVFEVPPPEE
jgi:4-amino-4-deoxy-L-arabinose transferase-like glycosyltransferase